MQRIIIIGNSGSGKSYLAQRLAAHLGYPVVDLDTLFWEAGGYTQKRPQHQVHAEVAGLSRGEAWIVEGVFGELAQLCFPRADILIWLDPDWETCQSNLLRRGAESDTQLDQQAAEASFASLLKWASEYWQRSGPRSCAGHQQLYQQFELDKIHLRSRQEIDDYISSATLH